MEFKIGAEIKITEDFEIEGVFGTKKEVKKGDIGFIDKNGLVHYISGEANGKIQKMADTEITKEYDYENIAKLILRRLIISYNLKEFLDDYEIEQIDIVKEIEDVLTDIF